MGVLHFACLILLLKSTSGFRCGPNSHFNVSATACPITCENKDNPPPCNLGCVPRCECNSGFVLNNLGNCVRTCDCRIACGPNSRFNPYAPGCPATCANKELRRSCKKPPTARCECIPGYVLNHEGKCIRECDCPSCGPNERFNPVASGCPITCENRGIPNLCTAKPRPRCECIDGFVLDVNGVCVAEGSCPRCAPNSRYMFCGSACPRTCENKDLDLICNLKCQPGCVCRKGYVKGPSGNCIKECECPSCPPNSRFKTCASACPLTCANKGTPVACTKQCVARCDCNPGFVLDHEGNCIPERSCPRCGPNQIFNPRSPACQRSCQNPNADKECAIVGLRPRCECIRGFVLDHEGNCIPERNCPRCGPNQIFNPRASACIRTCENNNFLLECNLGVKPRCECIRGFVQDHDGNCIPERNCPSCPDNSHFEPHASACVRTCQNANDIMECNLGFKSRCVCNDGFVLDHNGVCILEANCPRCGPNQIFNPRASACIRTCENKNFLLECNLGVKPRCECIRGFVQDHDGNCIPERNCPSCPDNSHFEPHASACVRTCQNANDIMECNLGFKSRCVCNDGFVLDHNGVCILEANCPRCGPNQIFNPRASACIRTCENKNLLLECNLGVKPRCECIRGYVQDHDGNCIPKRNCPSCPDNSHFEPHASACMRTCQNANDIMECTLGFKSRCVCNDGFVLDHNGVCILEANCPRCGPNQIFNPRASACIRTCENKNFLLECNLGVKPRCECIRGFVQDHDGNCIPERNCPSCPDNSHFEPHASACVRTCQNANDIMECNLGFKSRCVCNDGFVLDHNGVCILEANCPRCGPYQFFNPLASACIRTCENMNVLIDCNLGFKPRCQCIPGFVLDHDGNCIPERNCPSCPIHSHFEPHASACPITCENMNAIRECPLGFKSRCVCDPGFVLDHNGVCILEGNCLRCGPNQVFNPRASACVRTCENKNLLRECSLGFKAKCECKRGFVLDHDGNCIPERNCPSCAENSHFEPHALACVRTCENMHTRIQCTSGFKGRCVCNPGFIRDHNGVCILEGNCPRCGPNQIFNPRASACPCTCENPNANKGCKLGMKARCDCIRGFVLDHEGNCIPERNCPRCGPNQIFNPRASACPCTCENPNASKGCKLGFKARCDCIRGFVLDHEGNCIDERSCPRCGPNEFFNPHAAVCACSCENPNASKECKLGFKARCACIRGFVLNHEGKCIDARDCPRCGPNEFFNPHASACACSCENPNASKECKLGFKARCACVRGFVLNHEGKCIDARDCPRCGPNEFFNPHASACACSCENPNASKECKLGSKARCACVRGFVLNHEGKCIDARDCPRCGPNEFFNPHASACACSCENPNASKECKLGLKARCACVRGFVLNHEGKCIDARDCPRCGPNQYFNPRSSACPCTCENPNASKGCKLGMKARCDCIRGFVLDHEGNCIDERSCPRCQENAHFEPRASACIRSCENMNALVDCTLGFKARCVCNDGFILDHNGVCIPEASCPRCGPNQVFNPRASSCTRTCENPNADKDCQLGIKARCECMRGYVMDHEGNCIEERSCPRCQENAHFEPHASACIRTCENMNALVDCTLGFKARCVCDKGYILDHTGVCIREANCPRCGPNEYFNTRASACKCTCENPNASKDCKLGPEARCDCIRGYVLDHNGVCVPEASCPRCGPNEFFNPRASGCKCTCENPNASKGCKLGPVARCDCIRGFVLDHNGVCVPEASCPRCGPNEYFNPRASACKCTCENPNASKGCKLGSVARCDCVGGYVLDHNGVCVPEASCPRCGPNEYFNPRASACKCTCENPNANKDCKLGPIARCDCVRGYVLDHNGVCIPEATCPRCGLFEVFNPRASGCIRTCENRNAIGDCSLGIRARCECIPGYVVDHKGDCIRENKCPSCGPNSHFNPKAPACVVTCQNMDNREECKLGTEARCECDKGYVLDHNGVCIKSNECIKCGPHSHFNPKASACPITCDNFDQPRHCRLGLVARCECDDGFILHPNGNCVEQCDCPVKCPPNSHYNHSASACPITCQNRKKAPICNAPNVARCQCDNGFVLNNKGICIPECDCQPNCGPNEHFNWCAPVDPITCLNRNSPRPFSEACVARCECNDGFILNNEGKCVKECECKECKPNAHYTDCVSNCPRTCSNLNDVLLCSKECRSGGCECNPGFVFDNYGNCVREHDCPDPRCGRHAFFSHHLPNIQITCANRHQRRAVEFSYCAEGGCRCKNGFVLDGYGNCILESDCPKLMRM